MFPHPLREPAGHSYGHVPIPCEPLTIGNWRTSVPYLWGIDLFNHGYYWEAHESWEGVWLASGRAGTVADFLKGLIKLAAAGVKAREGNAAGVARHAHRATDLFQQIAAGLDRPEGIYLGLRLPRLLDLAAWLANNTAQTLATSLNPVVIVMPQFIEIDPRQRD